MSLGRLSDFTLPHLLYIHALSVRSGLWSSSQAAVRADADSCFTADSHKTVGHARDFRSHISIASLSSCSVTSRLQNILLITVQVGVTVGLFLYSSIIACTQFSCHKVQFIVNLN